jgi:beta-galactosidase/beta-glucuronidase
MIPVATALYRRFCAPAAGERFDKATPLQRQQSLRLRPSIINTQLSNYVQTSTQHLTDAERIQTALIREMTPGWRLEIAQSLYETGWQLKAAWPGRSTQP